MIVRVLCVSVIGVCAAISVVASVSAAEVRVYPPPPPAVSPIAGAIDFHVHSAPDVFGRGYEDADVGRLAARRGMRALVLKNHVTSTADRALMLTKAVPEIEAFGGIVLNQAVGGINAAAVEWMYRMEGGRGRVVWLPSFDADYHLRTFGEPGEGLKVAVDGVVTPQMEKVLRVIAREDLVLCTSHVSPEEALAVIRRGRELGASRFVITHAMANVPGFSIAQMKEAASMGAYMELVFLNDMMGPKAYLPWMRHWKRVSIEDMAAAIKQVGAAHFILSSDLGQTGNPAHPDGYKLLVDGLGKAGVSRADIDLMMKRNPAWLLGLDG